MEEWSKKVNIKFQQLLDKSAPFKLYRWLGLGALVALYAVRVFSIKGFYIITYALAIYNLNLLLGFISPSTDPELDGPVLPSRSDDEYRPFVRRLQEMKFWMMSSRAFLIGLTATLFPFLDIPVFWPILLMYWLVLVGITMRRQIKHMIKYKYLPFDFGKQVQPLIAGERTGSSSDPLSHTMAYPQRQMWCRKGRTVRPRFEETEL